MNAVGGGLLEVLVSPIVESLPGEHKEKAMSLLHSFYCWGSGGGGAAFYGLFLPWRAWKTGAICR